MHRSAAVLASALIAAAAPALAYTPGSGSLYSESFDDNSAQGWTSTNGSSSSAWTIAPFGGGGNLVWDADGYGQSPTAPTLHLASRNVHPVPAASWSTAFFWRADGGVGFRFRVDVEQKAPVARTYRLEVDATGKLSLLRANAGPFTVLAESGAGFVRFGADRYIRFAIEEQGGQQLVRARIWTNSATREPSTWDLSAADPLRTLERVHRMTITNDGPKGAHTRLDDLEMWGDGSQGVLSSIKTIYVCEWSHLDIGFTETPQAIEQYYKDTLDQVLANLDADPGYKWTIEESWMLQEWLERSTEAEKPRMFDALRSGRIRLAAGFASLAVGEVGHEEMARSIYPALELARREGFRVRTYIQDDVPSSPFSLPEMLASAGVEYYLGGINASFGGELLHPSMAERPFWWQGPDGSRVLAWHTFDGYAEAWDHGLGWFDTLQNMYDEMGIKLPEHEGYGYPHDTLMIMRAFDNNYTGLWTKQRVDDWNATYATPKLVLAHPEEFLDLMKTKLGNAIPTFTGDYGPGWSAATGNHEVRQIRDSRRTTRVAEALGAVAALVGTGGDPRPAIGRAWNLILTADEHSGGGSWGGYFNTQEMLDSIRYFQNVAADAVSTSHAALDSAADAIASAVPSEGRDSLVVLNGLLHERGAWVRAVLPADLYDSEFMLWDRVAGAEIAYQRFPVASAILFRADRLPSLGYRVYDLRPGTPTAVPAGTLSVVGNVIENDFYRVMVDPSDGAVSSLVWKPGTLELVDSSSSYRFNRLGRSTHGEIFFGVAPTAEPAGTPVLSVGDAGPLAASLVVTRDTTPHARAEVRLYRGDDRVEIVNTLDRTRMPYVAGGETLTWGVGFPFDVHGFQIRTDRTNRFFDPVTDNFPRDPYFTYHDIEHAMDFWDGTFGVTNACAEAPTHDFQTMATLGSSIPATDGLLWSRLVQKSDEYQYDDGQYHPVDYEPGTSPLYEFHHELRAHGPHHDPVVVNRFGFDVLAPVPVRLVRDQSGGLPADAAAFLEADDPTVSGYTVKLKENGSGLVLRIAELTGVERTVRISSSLLTLSNPRLLSFVEDESDPLSMDGPDGFLVPIGPYQTVTVGVDASLPITLRADKNAAAQAVHLSWSGGAPPFVIERASRPDFLDAIPLQGSWETRVYDDPALDDGRSWYYRVR